MQQGLPPAVSRKHCFYVSNMADYVRLGS
jgi:hypothetical protein